MTVFTGNANPQLARQIVQHLGLPLGNAIVDKFSDGEIRVELQENVRGKDVFVIQPTKSRDSLTSRWTIFTPRRSS